MAKSTIQKDPFEVIPKSSSATSESSTKSTKSTTSTSSQRFTVHLPVEIVERMKNAAYWTPGLTLAGFCENAIEKELKKIEKENGGEFDSRPTELKGGRPIS